jgi:hypothetical protein
MVFDGASGRTLHSVSFLFKGAVVRLNARRHLLYGPLVRFCASSFLQSDTTCVMTVCVIGIFSHQPLFRIFIDVTPVKPIIVFVPDNVIVKPSLPDLLFARFLRKALKGSDEP